MTDRDRVRLVGVHPKLVAAVEAILGAMADRGHPMFVVEGVRTPERQAALYAQGRTVAGVIVTHNDGVIIRSNHQPREDHWGHAVDCAFLSGDPFSQTHPWEDYGALAEAHGLRWGGRFTTILDLPHVELIEVPSGAKRA